MSIYRGKFLTCSKEKYKSIVSPDAHSFYWVDECELYLGSHKLTASNASDSHSSDGSESYSFGNGLNYDSGTRTVSVDTANAVTENDQRPVSSAAVYSELGNIESLLRTI